MTQAFLLQNEHFIPSLNLTLQEYKHKRLGTLHYHLASDHQENVFAVALRTVPTDSKGVAHILEHTVLCGSKKYPVRDPFFMMIRRSLNTFMNAFTASDWTAYPFASQNRKDFFNLLDVYLDAVFFPRIDALDFAQEGHRFAFSEDNNIDSDLVYKGVVYNEMKGAMSSPVSKLWHTLNTYLYDNTTYHHNSGGDPSQITELSHQELTGFYQKHYHPSNATFFTFGNIEAAEHQQRFEQAVLSQFEPSDAHIRVGIEKPRVNPLSVETTYAANNDKKAASHIVLAWLLGDNTNFDEVLEAQFLSDVLLSDSASPLLKALETSPLASAPSPLCGLEEGHRSMCFVCGVEGSEAKHAEQVEQLILDTLADVAKNGVEESRLSALLDQLELAQREIGGGSYPYGLQLIMQCISPVIHHSSPLPHLDITAHLDKLRQKIKQKDFIPGLINKLFLNNPHRVRLTLKPDSAYFSKANDLERQQLAHIKAALSQQQLTEIKKLNQQLDQRQQQKDDESILPKVTLDDVPAKQPQATGHSEQLEHIKLHYYAQGTNGLVYQDVIVALPDLSPELLPYLPYYASCLPELGCGEEDYLARQSLQTELSAGINGRVLMRGLPDDTQNLSAYFVLSSKALDKKQNNFFKLMHSTLNTVRFDEKQRIADLMAQIRADKNKSITGSGHQLAMLAASSGISNVAQLQHRLHGLAGIKWLNDTQSSLEDGKKLDNFAEQLKSIHQQLNGAPLDVLVINEAEQQQNVLSSLNTVWNSNAVEKHNSRFSAPPVNTTNKTFWITNTDVNFCALSLPTVAMTSKDSAPLSVLAGLLRNGFLHRAIREQGGAYGGGAVHDVDIGAFQFYSYRDPRIEGTLADFNQAIEWFLAEDHQWQAVEEAILGVISSIDKPSSPAGEAKKAFYNTLYGRTDEVRGEFRSRVLAVTLEDLQRVSKEYLLNKPASIAVISSNDQVKFAEQNGFEIINLT